MFNPFRISQASDEAIINSYTNIQNSLAVDPETGFEIATNIERYANMGYLLGEMIARYKEQYNNLKSSITIQKSKQIYKQRDIWIREHNEKAPAMSYFEALAEEFVQKETAELGQMDSNIDRFKNALSSITEKQNALKKKLEIMRYEL